MRTLLLVLILLSNQLIAFEYDVSFNFYQVDHTRYEDHILNQEPLINFVEYKNQDKFIALSSRFSLFEGLTNGDLYFVSRNKQSKLADEINNQKETKFYVNEFYSSLLISENLNISLGKKIVQLSEFFAAPAFNLINLRDSKFAFENQFNRGEKMTNFDYYINIDSSFSGYIIQRDGKDEYTQKQQNRKEYYLYYIHYFDNLEVKALALTHQDNKQVLGTEWVYVFTQIDLKLYTNLMHYSKYIDDHISLTKVASEEVNNATLGINYVFNEYHQMITELWQDNSFENEDYRDFFALIYIYDNLDDFKIQYLKQQTLKKVSSIDEIQLEYSINNLLHFYTGVRKISGKDKGYFRQNPTEKQVYLRVDFKLFSESY